MSLARRFISIATLCGAALIWAAPAASHGYRIGTLEITHPAIAEPLSGTDCTCAHLRIRNMGTETEVFLGARIEGAASTRLISFAQEARNGTHSLRIAIPPGETLDLHHGWCLFMSGITSRLEADMNVISGQLLFEKAGTIPIEFMIDAHH